MSPRILIVENDPVSLQNTRQELELNGYQTDSAQDGLDGLEIIRRRPPQMVLCDIVLPRLDGMALLNEIRRHPASAGLPFIFLAVQRDWKCQRAAMNGGADDYLIKPFKHDDLILAIETRLCRLGLPTVPMDPDPGVALSPREREVFALLGHGCTTREIASRLQLSPRTIDSHRARIMQKFGLETAAALIHFASRSGETT